MYPLKIIRLLQSDNYTRICQCRVMLLMKNVPQRKQGFYERRTIEILPSYKIRSDPCWCIQTNIQCRSGWTVYVSMYIHTFILFWEIFIWFGGRFFFQKFLFNMCFHFIVILLIIVTFFLNNLIKFD